MFIQSFVRRLSCFVILVFLATNAFAQTRVISVAAGTGTAGFSGDGGPATSARLDRPSDVSIDSEGNFYIADRNNNRIRKVNVASGTITTVAGNGVAGWFFSGGPAVFASLDHPSGVDVDAAGNLYIADLLDNGISRIHKVTASSGTIVTLQLPVTLIGAVAIALDSVGDLYIAEQSGNRIRKVTLSSGAITTVAGNGVPGFSGDGGPATSAQIHGPVHLAIDAAGNLIFTDSLNNRIRKVAAGTGIISTIAGSGTFGGPGGLKGDGGPATSAELNNPRGIAVDAAGDVLIADTGNRRIRKVNARTGVITTMASADSCAATANFSAPESVAVSASGKFIYVGDDNGSRVWTVALDGDIPQPTLTSIVPPGGVIGTTVTATLNGSGFAGGSGVTVTSGCSVNGTTVFVSGSGVTLSNVNVARDNAVTATFTIAPDAALGPRDVTITTDGGTTTAAQFIVQREPVPLPTLVSIAPSSGVRGSSATFTLTGSNFDARPGATQVSADGIGIVIGDVRVASATSLTATFNIAADATLGAHAVKVTTTGGPSDAVPFSVSPQGPTFVYGLPQMLNPTQQTPIELALANALPDPVTGTLTLTFVPNANNSTDDPNVMFINSQTSTRTVSVAFEANGDKAQFSLPSGVLEAGTVAGTIQLSVADVQVGGMPAVPTGSTFDVQIPRLPPVITGVRVLNHSSAGFDVEITGYSTSREISAATFTFGAASGAHLLTVRLQPDVISTFTTYYQSDASEPVGGAFVYTQPFLVKQGNVNAVASITVTLTNAQGTSEPKTVPAK